MILPATVISCVVDYYNLTMYCDDGQVITIPQGDPRIRDLVEKCKAADLDNGGTLYLTDESMAGKNHYAEVEKKSNGLVRFFKMAKSKFKEIAEKFCEPVAPVVLGKKPEMVHTVNGEQVEPDEFVPEPEAPKLPAEEDRPLTKGADAVAEIMANAVSTKNGTFASVATAEIAKSTGVEEEVVVAVLGDNTIIHGVEQLEDQFKAVTAGVTSVDGMQLFLNRAASVARGHSVEDLLKFVQKGELPFADDGTVLVYKRLNPTSDPEVFVDCHSGRVLQRIGSKVHMDEALVDANRRQDCSNGLHVARRDYLTAFHGSVVVLCKLAPEDVIAVPQYDARKLRAKAYHIIARLSDSDARRVCSNQPMEDTELLANCIAGNHTPITEYVEITEQKGGGLKVTKVESPEQRAEAATRAVTSLDEVPNVCNGPVTVDARAIALDLAAAGTKDTTVQTTFNGGDVIAVNAVAHNNESAGLTVKDGQIFAAPGVIYHAPPGNMVVCQVDESCGQATPPPAPKAASKSPAQKLVDAFNEATTPSAKGEAAKALVAFKKKCKKSWTALGIATPVWTKATEIVEALDFGAKNAVTKADLAPAVEAIAKTLPKAAPKNDDKSFPVPSVKKAAPTLNPLAAAVLGAAKPSIQKKVVPKKPVSAQTPPATKADVGLAKITAKGEKKMTQQEEMDKLVRLYQANPDKLNARAIYAFKQKSKKSWDVLGVTDKKFIAKITERAKL